MTLEDFIIEYDKDGSIVLLEGKRDVLEDDKGKLVKLGKLFCSVSKKIIFRSGNANGADLFFSLGIISEDKSRLETITPYTGHREKSNLSGKTIPLDSLNISEEAEVIRQSKLNKKMDQLIDQYVTVNINHYSTKAAYIIRDTVKVIGSAASNIKPAVFGIFYDDLNNPGVGGTGHTMNICRHNNVPFIDQRIWFDWVNNVHSVR